MRTFNSDKFFVSVAIFIFLVAASLDGLHAQDAKADEKEEAKDKKPATVTAETQAMRLFEQLEGVLQCDESTEIKTDVKAWTDLTIEDVVPQGQMVKAGEVVLKFNTEKIDDAILEAEFAVKSAALALEDAKLASEQATIEFDLNSAMNEREMKDAKNDFAYYQEVERKQREKNLDWSLKTSDYSVEYAEEELDQLMQMYTEDELTEESEKIVLKRAQRSLESSKHFREQRQESAKRQREATFPREDSRREDSLKRQELKYAKQKTTLPFARDRAEIALRKAEFAMKKAERKLNDLQEDRNKMDLKSEMQGVLFHGRYANGKWTGATGGSSRELETDKKLGAKKIALTVINPAKLSIRAEIPEAKVKHFKKGTAGTAILKADDSQRWQAKIKEINPVPSSTGARVCTFEIDGLKNDDASILPTMNCKISVGIYENDSALVVPKASVFSDDGFTHYVFNEDKERKEVEVGHTSGDKIEITKGLKAGDKILKSKP